MRSSNFTIERLNVRNIYLTIPSHASDKIPTYRISWSIPTDDIILDRTWLAHPYLVAQITCNLLRLSRHSDRGGLKIVPFLGPLGHQIG